MSLSPSPHFHGWRNAHIAGPADFTDQIMQGAVHGIFEIADICVLVIPGKGAVILDDLDAAKGVVHFHKVRQLRPIRDMRAAGLLHPSLHDAGNGDIPLQRLLNLGEPGIPCFTAVGFYIGPDGVVKSGVQ